MSDESNQDLFQNKYEAFYAMGNSLYKSKQYRRAIWYYSQAISADPSKPRPLTERGYCYLQLSQYDKALADIEKSGSIDKKNPKILLLHGETYYNKGEFEKALIIYQRGKRLRPSIEEFQLGINKCELCIKKASTGGKKDKINLTDDMDLTEYYEEAFPELKEQKLAKEKQKKQIQQKKSKGKNEQPEKESDDLPDKIPSQPFNRKTMNTLLESTATDRRFVDDVYEIETQRKEFISGLGSAPPHARKLKDHFSTEIQKDTIESAVYMDNKTNFWYRQDPKRITKLNKKQSNSNRNINAIGIQADSDNLDDINYDEQFYSDSDDSHPTKEDWTNLNVTTTMEKEFIADDNNDFLVNNYNIDDAVNNDNENIYSGLVSDSEEPSLFSPCSFESELKMC